MGHLLLPVQVPVTAEGRRIRRRWKSGKFIANALSFLWSFSKAFSLSLIKSKCYYKGRDGLLGEENNKTYQITNFRLLCKPLIRADTPTFT